MNAAYSIFFFFNDTATTEIYTLSLHDALPISHRPPEARVGPGDEHHRAAETACASGKCIPLSDTIGAVPIEACTFPPEDCRGVRLRPSRSRPARPARRRAPDGGAGRVAPLRLYLRD